MGSGDYVLGGADPGQHDWRWCNKCQGIYFAQLSPGVCPAGGTHDVTGSGDYVLGETVGGTAQNNWRWCKKCQGLHFVGAGNPGICPAGGGHEVDGSGDYTLSTER